MNNRPIHDRIIVTRKQEEPTSPGGIVIPDTAKEKPIQGEVVAIGTGRHLANGKIITLHVKMGDRILFGKYAGAEVKLDGEELLVMREDDVMAIVEH